MRSKRHKPHAPHLSMMVTEGVIDKRGKKNLCLMTKIVLCNGTSYRWSFDWHRCTNLRSVTLDSFSQNVLRPFGRISLNSIDPSRPKREKGTDVGNPLEVLGYTTRPFRPSVLSPRSYYEHLGMWSRGKETWKETSYSLEIEQFGGKKRRIIRIHYDY